MNNLLYSESSASEEDKSQFDWIHWKYHRLWTLEKLHPVLSLPLDIVDPILRSIGVLVKRLGSPIIGKLMPPLLNTVWEGIGALISVSSMIPIVGSVTGAFSTAHNVLSIPVGFIINEASSIIQFIIDATVEFGSLIFNLQRKNWSLVLDSLLNAFKYGLNSSPSKPPTTI